MTTSSRRRLEVDKVSPKLGVQWSVTDRILLRGAYFHTVKPLLANNRTLEPTQVAGFNQLFDDPNATKMRRYGVGLDWTLTDSLFVGAEATWRNLDAPFIDTDAGRAGFVNQNEQTHRAYAYWTPIPEIALSAELVYDRFKSERSVFTDEDFYPEDLETISVPLGIRYFHPTGLFAGFSATYVDQSVERVPGNELELSDGDDNFVVLDASVGYRFPNRLGIASLEFNNLLDNGFEYQDDSFREFDDAPSIGPYIPDRQILARITLNW